MQRETSLSRPRTRVFVPRSTLPFLLVLSVACVTELRAENAPQLRLSWIDSYKLLHPRQYDLMAQEVEALFGELGIDVAWRQGLPDAGKASVDQVTIILMRINSRAWGYAHNVLGTVLGRSSHRVYVFYPNVVAALRLPPRGTEKRDLGLSPMPFDLKGDKEIALAVGRVIAHETVHALCPEQAHLEDGLMSARLTFALLRGPRIVLPSEIARQVVKRLTPARLRQGGTLVVGRP